MRNLVEKLKRAIMVSNDFVNHLVIYILDGYYCDFNGQQNKQTSSGTVSRTNKRAGLILIIIEGGNNC